MKPTRYLLASACMTFGFAVLACASAPQPEQRKDGPDKPPVKFQPGKTPLGKTHEEIVANMLKLFDSDGDGKISRSEARGVLLENFERADLNKDQFIDRAELRVLADINLRRAGLGGMPKKGPFPLQPKPFIDDFDSFDKNADGRLQPAELRGTRWDGKFAEIDVDKSGAITKREYEAYRRSLEPKDVEPDRLVPKLKKAEKKAKDG